MLKVLLFFDLLYVVNELHFHLETGIPAVAPINILLLLTWLLIRGKEEVLPADVTGIARKSLFWFGGALIFAFLISEARSAERFIEDLTFLKNGLFYPLFYFLFLRCRQDEKTTRQLIIWVLIIAAVAGLEGLHEGIDYGFGHYSAFKRASGPFGADWHNANRAGVFYGMFMPMFVAIALFLRGAFLWRIGSIGAIIALAGGTISTYSRQSYFLVLLGFTLLILRRSVIVAVIIGAALVSAVSYLPESVTQRVEETEQANNTAHAEVDTSTASRWEIWTAAMHMWRDNPMGVGFHKFSYEIGNYSSEYKGFDAHNFYVRTLAECGPFGLVTLLLLMRTLFKLAAFVRRNVRPDDSEARALAYGFTIATLCMALGGIYGTPTLEGAVMAPYWALCGLLERYTRLKMMATATVAEPLVVEATLVERFPLAGYMLPGRRA